MKKSLRAFFCATGLLWAGTAAAQNTLPNANLDTWETRASGLNSYESPQGWVTSDDGIYQLFPPPAFAFLPRTIAKSTDRQSGTYAALLTPKTVASISIPAALLLGRRLRIDTSNPTNPANYGGAPYTARPTSMSFWYKFNGTATDQAMALVTLTRGNLSTTGEVLGSGTANFTGGTNTTYTLSNVPITYTSAATPDTLRMLFIVGANQTFSTSAAFSVDNISLSITTATNNPVLDAALSVYPNPSTNGLFSLASLQKPSIATAPLSVTDALGKVVLQQAAAPASSSNGRAIDLRGQPAGVYLLRLDTPEGVVVRKLQLQ